MAETVLLTGASGLIGRYVHRMLRERGDKVVAIDRIEGDDVLACDLSEVHRLHELGSKADAIIHCGALSGPMSRMPTLPSDPAMPSGVRHGRPAWP